MVLGSAGHVERPLHIISAPLLNCLVGGRCGFFRSPYPFPQGKRPREKSQRTLAVNRQSGWLQTFCSFPPPRNMQRSSDLASDHARSRLNDGERLVTKRQISHEKSLSRQFYSAQDLIERRLRAISQPEWLGEQLGGLRKSGVWRGFAI
jgi:hypothetical protein